MLQKNKPKLRKWNLNFGVALRAPKNSQDRFKTDGCGRRNSPTNLISSTTRWPQKHDAFPDHPSLSNIWSFMRTCRRTATGLIRPTQNHLHSRIQETMQKPTAWKVRKPHIKKQEIEKHTKAKTEKWNRDSTMISHCWLPSLTMLLIIGDDPSKRSKKSTATEGRVKHKTRMTSTDIP